MSCCVKSISKFHRCQSSNLLARSCMENIPVLSSEILQNTYMLLCEKGYLKCLYRGCISIYTHTLLCPKVSQCFAMCAFQQVYIPVYTRKPCIQPWLYCNAHMRYRVQSISVRHRVYIKGERTPLCGRYIASKVLFVILGLFKLTYMCIITFIYTSSFSSFSSWNSVSEVSANVVV